jgi:aminopeptidase N
LTEDSSAAEGTLPFRPDGGGSTGRWSVLVASLLVGLTACGEREALRPGVSSELARWRAEQLEDVRYDLRFSLPADTAEAVRGVAEIRFRWADPDRDLVLDFERPDELLEAVRVDGVEVEARRVQDHIVVPAGALRPGENTVRLRFRAGDGPLNRNPEYLYTLFVPARAREAFPAFDQPDLKARFRLTLEVPSAWRAVANGPELAKDTLSDGRLEIRFAETPPLPTYLFAFAAGRFDVETAEREGRTLRMFHRETDEGKVARNREVAFDLHATALDWLEDYTGIDYPFEKFDFVLIPSFQYNGMEHPGSVLYRASSVLLEPSATQSDLLGRASLIAHETAHMWFGDLVTMRWFDDVWMKEVFANFMAAKIVHPSFPELNHDLRFLLAHHPSAYAVDRSEGTHPIRQRLDNLEDAGSLYGAIIYQKAPIVMRHLERLMGETPMRNGLRAYLDDHRWDNASWPDLVRELDGRTTEDLATWSEVWVEEAGRPTVWVSHEADAGDGADSTERRLRAASVHQEDPSGRERIWNQRLRVAFGYADSVELLDVRARTARSPVPGAEGLPVPRWILPNGGGEGYGRFRLDEESTATLVADLPGLEDEELRAAAWLTLWDEMLHDRMHPTDFLEAAVGALNAESEELLVDRILGYLENAFWRYLAPAERASSSATVERALWSRLERAESSSLRASLFRTYRSVALTDRAVDRLRRVWSGEEEIPGLDLSEPDFTQLAQELALREASDASGILERQRERIENPDRRERFVWLLPSLSAEEAVRDSFFRSLAEPVNRRHEPWVVEGLGHLHHPLREEQAESYVLPALELLEEVEATGDIFFPQRWLDASLRGHGSRRVVRTVRDFLEEHPELSTHLRRKVLQSSDPVFRAARIRADVGDGSDAGG